MPWYVRHLFLRERCPNDIPGQIFQTLFVMRPDCITTVNVEPLAQTGIYQLVAYDKQERQGGPL